MDDTEREKQLHPIVQAMTDEELSNAIRFMYGELKMLLRVAKAQDRVKLEKLELHWALISSDPSIRF